MTANPRTSDEYAPRLYEEMRALARRYMNRERQDHTLQPTALVHEAYLRMSGAADVDIQGKTHFMALAATQMRRILVEHARAAGRKKRGSGRTRVTLTDGLAVTSASTLDVLAVDEALTRLEKKSGRQSRVVEQRLFSGMTVAEVAESLGVSETTVKEDWRLARAWLSRELRGSVS